MGQGDPDQSWLSRDRTEDTSWRPCHGQPRDMLMAAGRRVGKGGTEGDCESLAAGGAPLRSGVELGTEGSGNWRPH